MCFVGDQVNNFFEGFFSIDWYLQRYCIGIQFFFYVINNIEEICIRMVYFIDEINMWYFIMVSLMLYSFRLRFYIRYGIEQSDNVI